MRKKNISNTFIKLTLSQALVKLMDDIPYNEITITDICKASGFGRTTYYRHFSNNKDDLLFFICDYYWKAYKEDNKEKVKKDEAFCLLSHLYNNKKFILKLKKNNLLYLFYIIFNYVLKSKENKFVDESYLMSFIIGGYYGAIHKWIEDDMKLTPIELKTKIEKELASIISDIQKKEINKL